MADGVVSVQQNDSNQRAIELFEAGVEKESNGLMSDAVDLYRRAFKLNNKVDLLYRKKKSIQTNAMLVNNHRGFIDEEIVKSIDVDKLLDSFEGLEILHKHQSGNSEDDENTDTIEETNVIPPSPLLMLPNDIWVKILEVLLIVHPESWFNFSITCKKNAFLGFGNSVLWEKLCNLVYPFQNYQENLQARTIESNPDHLPFPLTQSLIVPQYDGSWKKMLSCRPFIKFSGCYISVVNYCAEGGKAEFSTSWTNPVRVVTYYRYLRFFPDGKCIKILTHVEPKRIVPTLYKNIKELQIGNEKIEIFNGTWTINGDGEVHLTITEGPVPIYNFHYFFNIKSSGPIFRHNKLSWIKHHAIKKINTWDDHDLVEFPLKNEKPFIFSRVKRYHEQNILESLKKVESS